MHVLTILASSGDGDSGGGNPLGILPILVLFGVAIYFLMIRPQKKRQKAAAEMLRSIEVGDEVMTTSGVYGFVTGFEGDIAWLEIDDNVQIRISRRAIQSKVDTAAGDTAQPSDDGSGRSSKIPEPDAAVKSDDDSSK